MAPGIPNIGRAQRVRTQCDARVRNLLPGRIGAARDEAVVGRVGHACRTVGKQFAGAEEIVIGLRSCARIRNQAEISGKT